MGQSAREVWDRLRLKNKFLAIYLTVLVIPVCVIDAVFFQTTLHATRENALRALRNNQENAAQSIRAKMENAERVAELIARDARLNRLFGEQFEDETARAVRYQLEASDTVSNLLAFNPDISAIYLYNDGLLIGQMQDSFFTVVRERSPEEFARYDLAPPSAGPSGWIAPRAGLRNAVRPQLSPRRAVSFRRPLSPGSRTHVEILFDERDLFAGMYEQTQVTGGFTCIGDASGRVLFGAGGETAWRGALGGNLDAQERVERFGREMAVLSQPIQGLNAALITCAPARTLLRGMYGTAAAVAALSLVACVLSGWLFSLLAQRQLRAVPPMMEAMRRIRSGDFEARIEACGQDELGALARDFNYMSDRLRALMDQVYAAGQMEREAELRALEAHINPHFLYNSLATIVWMARARGCEEIMDTAQALAQLYRKVLSDGRAVLPLSEEMDIVRAYLKVQKVRFEDRFVAEIDVPEEALDFPLIKNIVQPLVENALEHGVCPLNAQGRVRVVARVAQDRLYLAVEDNGVGMTEEQRLRAARGEAQPDGRHGYALRNIRARLKLFYGEDYEFSLHSAPGRGTAVRIVLPRPAMLWKGGQGHVHAADRRG